MRQTCAQQLRVLVGEIQPFGEVLVRPHANTVVRFEIVAMTGQQLYYVTRGSGITPPPGTFNIDS